MSPREMSDNLGKSGSKRRSRDHLSSTTFLEPEEGHTSERLSKLASAFLEWLREREVRLHLRGQNLGSLRDRLPMAVLLFSRPIFRIIEKKH